VTTYGKVTSLRHVVITGVKRQLLTK